MYHPYIYEGMLIREIKQELNLMQSLPSRESTFILALSRLLLSQIQIPHHLVSEIFKIMCQPPTTAIPNHHQAIGDKLLLVVEANTADVTHTTQNYSSLPSTLLPTLQSKQIDGTGTSAPRKASTTNPNKITTSFLY